MGLFFLLISEDEPDRKEDGSYDSQEKTSYFSPLRGFTEEFVEKSPGQKTTSHHGCHLENQS
jgi:hypothetical protein